MRAFGKLFLALLLLTGVTLPLDQWTKMSARHDFLVHEDESDTTIYQGRREELISGEYGPFWFTLHQTYVRNHGASWGFWAALSPPIRIPFLIGAGILIAGALIWSAYQLILAGQRWPALFVCGIVAGSIGNFIDRVRLGYVVDFLTFKCRLMSQPFYLPSFNVADIVIVFSLFFLISTLFLDRNKKPFSEN